MSESSPEGRPQIPPMPDIKDTENLKPWMKTYIIKPPKGYDDMKHPDGTPFNEGEQIDAYIKQTIAVIEVHKLRNQPDTAYDKIRQSILNSTQPEDEDVTLIDK